MRHYVAFSREERRRREAEYQVVIPVKTRVVGREPGSRSAWGLSLFWIPDLAMNSIARPE